MRVFVTGAGGYIGGSIAARLAAGGHEVRGLVRSDARKSALTGLGITPVAGDLDDRSVLLSESRAADAVVNAADSDHRGAVEALIEALVGSGKPLLHTSGSSIVGDDAGGEPSDAIFDENTPLDPTPDKVPRVAIDRLVLDAGNTGVRSVVLCNSLIYGHGLGAAHDSVQLPALARHARESGIPRHVGRGMNIWSTVHIEDVVDVYLLALELAPAGSFLFVENGEASFHDMVAAIGRALKLGEPQPWPLEDAISALGFERAVYALGSNSRVRARLARTLGWSPRHGSVINWIDSEMVA